ncbi:MAG TPA: transposase [Chloroflexota bacterium]|nr:transposase [Chloroflexota bacterium]
MNTVGLRMRLAVPPEAAALLDAQSRIHGWWHNHLVERVNAIRSQRDDQTVRQLLYSPYGLRNLLTEAKQTQPFLRSCWTYSLQAVAIRMTATVKKTRTAPRSPAPWAGWPRFHRWSTDWAALEYHALTGGFTLANRTLKLTFGREEDGSQIHCSVSLVERLPPYARPSALTPAVKATHPIRGLRIIREHGVYYAVFIVRRELAAVKPLPTTPRVISLDPHHYSLAVAVDTDGMATRIPYPPGVRPLGRRIDQLKARRDTCVRAWVTDERGIRRAVSSKRWKEFDALIQQTQRRREARITQYLYEVANWLCRHYEVIAIGDYRPGQATHAVSAVNRWVHNESLVGRLRQTVAWVAQRSGRRYLTWPEEGTTRTCHYCGNKWIDGIPTGRRYYYCPGCGHHWRRNECSASNGLRLALLQINSPLSDSGRLEIGSRRTYRSTGLVVTAGAGAGADSFARPIGNQTSLVRETDPR